MSYENPQCAPAPINGRNNKEWVKLLVMLLTAAGTGVGGTISYQKLFVSEPVIEIAVLRQQVIQLHMAVDKLSGEISEIDQINRELALKVAGLPPPEYKRRILDLERKMHDHLEAR